MRRAQGPSRIGRCGTDGSCRLPSVRLLRAGFRPASHQRREDAIRRAAPRDRPRGRHRDHPGHRSPADDPHRGRPARAPDLAGEPPPAGPHPSAAASHRSHPGRRPDDTAEPPSPRRSLLPPANPSAPPPTAVRHPSRGFWRHRARRPGAREHRRLRHGVRGDCGFAVPFHPAARAPGAARRHAAECAERARGARDPRP